MEEKERSSFSGALGFVMAAAGSAVGLGNIWRFPYLAAKNGGGLFLITYLVLVVTFGFTLLVSEIAIGRKTKSSPILAYRVLHPKWKWLGNLTVIVPLLVLPYYGVIGGWVLKYATVYLTGHGSDAANASYFDEFIASPIQPVIFLVVFLLLSSLIVQGGISGGIERVSKILMPILIVIVIGISIYVLTISHTADGITTTGIDALLVYIIPDVSGLTFSGYISVLVDAMGQLFFSIGVATGVMIAFGSYLGDKENMIKNIGHIELFDTMVAFLAGIMIIVPLYIFFGREGMNASGSSLLFVAMPGVFAQLGTVGQVIGAVFFMMVFFAALTSSAPVMEAIASSWSEKYGMSRKKAVLIVTIISFFIGLVICLGYNALYFDATLPNGTSGQMLDVLDYISSNILMPVVALASCILIGWVLKPEVIIQEATKNGEKFKRRHVYSVIVRFVAPVLIFVLLLQAFGVIK